LEYGVSACQHVSEPLRTQRFFLRNCQTKLEESGMDQMNVGRQEKGTMQGLWQDALVQQEYDFAQRRRK
jgi:hypothetical protein